MGFLTRTARDGDRMSVLRSKFSGAAPPLKFFSSSFVFFLTQTQTLIDDLVCAPAGRPRIGASTDSDETVAKAFRVTYSCLHK